MKMKKKIKTDTVLVRIHVKRPRDSKWKWTKVKMMGKDAIKSLQERINELTLLFSLANF